jgi:uncharacterized membrane protein
LKRIALLALAATFALTFVPGPWSYDAVSDLPVYRFYGDAMTSGQLPYRDFGVEYPPLALPAFGLPALVGGDAGTFRLAFAAVMLVAFAAVVLLTGALAQRSEGNRLVALLGAAAAPLFVAALVRTRFDLLPVALTLGALLLLCRDRPRAAMFVLGLGVMTKGFPLAVAPVGLAWLAGAGRRRDALQGVAVLAATVAALAAVAVLASPSGVWDTVSYHLDRPVQVESSPAVVLYALDVVGSASPVAVKGFGSDGLSDPVAGTISTGFAVLMLATIAAFAAGAARASDRRSLVLASLGAVAAFAALGKVLSPQFLIWVAPLVALALSWRLWGVAVTGIAALLLTKVEFPGNYLPLVQGDAGPKVLVAARDSLLLAAVVLTLAEVLSRSAAPAPGSARWRWPVRPGRPRPAPR